VKIRVNWWLFFNIPIERFAVIKVNNFQNKLDAILQKAAHENRLEKEEIIFLLNLRKPRQVDAVFKVAQDVRSRYFRNRVFLYGFIYLSTHCRNQCNFCYYRKQNTQPERYRRRASDVVAAARSLADSGVHLIDLTMGEDPLFYRKQGYGPFMEMIKAVRLATGLPIMVSPGVVPPDVLMNFGAAGVSWYACYQETHNRKLFKQLRPGQSYTARMEIKKLAGKMGLLTEEGLLCGVGESDQDIADSIEAMGPPRLSQLRAMTFVPQKGTPMQSGVRPDPLREMLTIAVMRMMYPNRLIPATLDVDGLKGLKSRLEAGANVVTSLVPPGFGLAGVARKSLDIDDARRTVDGILPELEKLGLEPSSADDYISWLDHRRRKIRCVSLREKVAC
jgi:methylornithine synthase